MMDIREKLVELLREVQYLGGLEEKISDHLIANNVTVSEEVEELKADNQRLREMWAKAVSELSKASAVQEWIPVTERLPKPEEEVWVQCERGQFGFKYQCNAFYIPPKWLREESDLNWDYECCNEYDEEADDYYVNEGWYERIYNWDDYGAVGIGDFVTHWMPLPQPPKGE